MSEFSNETLARTLEWIASQPMDDGGDVTMYFPATERIAAQLREAARLLRDPVVARLETELRALLSAFDEVERYHPACGCYRCTARNNARAALAKSERDDALIERARKDEKEAKL